MQGKTHMGPVKMPKGVSVWVTVMNVPNLGGLAVIIFFEVVIRHERVRANRRACFNMLAHVAAKLRSPCIRNYFQNYARKHIALSALKDALHGCFLNPRIAYLVLRFLCM